MANNIYAHTKEAVRVKVKKCELNAAPEWRKFSVDPQITSLEVLYSLLAKAFDIKSDFAIKYKAYDPAGNELYLAVLSDWDLDAAFLRIHNLSIQTSTEPCLLLQIDIKPFTEVKEWEAAETPVCVAPAITNASYATPTGGTRELMAPLQQSLGASQKYVQHMQTKLPGLILNQMEKTFSIVQKAFNLSEETMSTLPPRAPLSDSEFRMFLDSLGQVQRNDELRKVIFLGGIDPSLRRVVWKHILNVYPNGMNGKQRMDYMRRKSEHYYRLRDTWKLAVKQGCVVGELSYVTSMVKKDVLRTDRLHPFYAGSDDNQNIAALFNILTTYALNHPSVSYCQGMSDIASPLLVTMNDEAQAYICFCAIMSRVRVNFMLDGIAMTQKFAHLTEALSVYDPEFWEYLKSQQADDLLFCYRWLLLELKREFPFEDALRMLEVQWSSLKYDSNSDKELALYEKEFTPSLDSSAPTTSSSLSGSLGAAPLSPSYLQTKQRENPYTKVCALRRQSSSASLSSLSSSLGNSSSQNALNHSKLDTTKRLNQSLDDNISRHTARRNRHASAKAHQSLDESKMLMLMECLENTGKTDIETVGNHDNDRTEDNVNNAVKAEVETEDDDDVFTNAVDAVTHFNFHPTNPFIQDAQEHTAVDANDKCSAAANSNAFLNSNCSSPLAVDAATPLEDAKQLPKSIMKLHNKNIISNYNAVSNIIAKQLTNASTGVDAAAKKTVSGGVGGGGHFKDLKEKIAASSKRGMTLDELSTNEKSQQKLVKNFNEFLNFAALNKSRISDKLSINSAAAASNAKDFINAAAVTTSPTKTQSQSMTTPTTVLHPLVQLTKSGCNSSFDESDSSSLHETTCSCSTAATAIQQTHNLSNNSLQLELQTTPTPEAAETTLMATDGNNLTPDDSQDQEYYPMTTAITRELRLDAENLDRQVFGAATAATSITATSAARQEFEYEKLDKDSLDLVDDLKENEIIACPDIGELLVRKRARDAKAKASVKAAAFNNAQHAFMTTSLDGLKLNPFIDESGLGSTVDAMPSPPVHCNNLPTSNSLPEVIVPLVATNAAATSLAPIELATNAADEIAFARSPQHKTNGESGNVSTGGGGAALPPALPSPSEFGGGNPFLMFLCLTLLLQHRNTIIKSGMDYNEMAMHFDKMVRKHDVTRVLNQARRMYIAYLKAQTAYNPRHITTQSSAAAAGDASDLNKNNTLHCYASTTTKS